MFVLPCSARKRRGGSRGLRGDTILDLLPSSLADRLTRARQKLRLAAALDESLLLPAWQRYEGAFYRAETVGEVVNQFRIPTVAPN